MKENKNDEKVMVSTVGKFMHPTGYSITKKSKMTAYYCVELDAKNTRTVLLQTANLDTNSKTQVRRDS